MTDAFVALADPTRRWILDRLQANGPQSIKNLAAPLDITRQGVTKHLDVLESAGLVEREMRGRESVCTLCAGPLRVIDAWLERYSAQWDRRLDRLRRQVERHNDEGDEDG